MIKFKIIRKRKGILLIRLYIKGGLRMKEQIVRLQSLELENFKNVQGGKIEMPLCADKTIFDDKAEILGLYGQNGSGKTAVINALGFLKQLLSGERVDSDIADYITKGYQRAACNFKFYMQKAEMELLVEYIFSIEEQDDISVISEEKITFSKKEKEKWSSKVTLCDYHVENKNVLIKPKYKWDVIIGKSRDNRIDMEVARKMTMKEKRSFLFSEDVIHLLEKVFGEASEFGIILRGLSYYGKANLFVINNNFGGASSLDIALPLTVKSEEINPPPLSNLTISLSQPTIMRLKEYKIVKEIVHVQNLVIQSLVPSLQLLIKEYGTQMVNGGEEGMRFELLAKKEEAIIPLRYESEGIKKLLAILNLLISVYNHSSMCIVIDELDAGIYEYLLGELLGIIEESGKGQLIFTSHNLRPLEMISREALVFTTTNPNNRYIKITPSKRNNNLRDLYLRSINLGGQKEQIYDNTSNFQISRAFRKAGRTTDGKN